MYIRIKVLYDIFFKKSYYCYFSDELFVLINDQLLTIPQALIDICFPLLISQTAVVRGKPIISMYVFIKRITFNNMINAGDKNAYTKWVTQTYWVGALGLFHNNFVLYKSSKTSSEKNKAMGYMYQLQGCFTNIGNSVSTQLSYIFHKNKLPNIRKRKKSVSRNFP